MPLFHNVDPCHKLKSELKRWERSFFKINGRKPGKEDIEAAGKDVCRMYKKYWSAVRSKSSARTSDKGSDAKHLVEKNDNVPKKDAANERLDQKESAPVPLPNGVWDDSLLKKNFKAADVKQQEENTALKPFLMRLQKLHLDQKYVKTNLSNGMFSLRRKRKSSSTLVPESAPQPVISASQFGSDSKCSACGESGHLRHECSLVNPAPTADVPSYTNSIWEDETAVQGDTDLDADSIIKSAFAPETSPSSGIFSTNSPFDVNENSSQSLPQAGSSCSGPPSIKLFDEEDDYVAMEMEQVKETFAEELREVVFDGCELLPMDFKLKKKKNPPTAKALKKRNDNYCVRVNMNQKKYSRGYKKRNVGKEKRRAHYQAKRNKCFACGESGHWRHECPLINKSAAKSSESPATTFSSPLDPETDPTFDDHENIPFLPADHVLITDMDDAIDEQINSF